MPCLFDVEGFNGVIRDCGKIVFSILGEDIFSHCVSDVSVPPPSRYPPLCAR